MSAPKFSIIMAAYQRAHTLPRALASVLAQTTSNWEVVVVDDGSTDATEAIVSALAATDTRIRYVKHERNRGVTAAKNTGFDHARGEWLMTLDSDDEIVPQALAVFERVLDLDPAVDAIACNCFDSRTGALTGRGLDHDQYITLATRLERCRGEHWGIFHRRILGAHRFNERIRGYEDVLWTEIHEHAMWYYVHRALRVYHTEGTDRLTSEDGAASRKRLYALYRAIVDEAPDYFARLGRGSPSAQRRFLFNAAGQFLLHDDDGRFGDAVTLLDRAGGHVRARALRVARDVDRRIPLRRLL
ncbi:glycosyltransferase family 2 protein [soil metagenome]